MWLLQNIIGIISIIVGSFIAYHVYFLSKRLGLKDRLAHKDSVRKRVEPILSEIRRGINSKVELVNVKKYFSHYPNTNERNRHGYTYLGAELKALRFDGVEFFCAVRAVYRDSDGKLSLCEGEGLVQEEHNILEVGIIPYEWIEYVDAGGDEFSYRPQFFTQFNGPDKSPYKYLVYYEESNVYREGNDPLDMKWRMIEVGK